MVKPLKLGFYGDPNPDRPLLSENFGVVLWPTGIESMRTFAETFGESLSAKVVRRRFFKYEILRRSYFPKLLAKLVESNDMM